MQITRTQIAELRAPNKLASVFYGAGGVSAVLATGDVACDLCRERDAEL